MVRAQGLGLKVQGVDVGAEAPHETLNPKRRTFCRLYTHRIYPGKTLKSRAANSFQERTWF